MVGFNVVSATSDQGFIYLGHEITYVPTFTAETRM